MKRASSHRQAETPHVNRNRLSLRVCVKANISTDRHLTHVSMARWLVNGSDVRTSVRYIEHKRLLVFVCNPEIDIYANKCTITPTHSIVGV